MKRLLKEMPKHEGGRPTKTCTKTEQVSVPSYTELGIKRKDASEWQLMAENEKLIVTNPPH
jgi:hypothetical protein